MNRLEWLKNFILGSAATALLFLSGIFLPLFGILLMPFVPQPALTFGAKYGKGSGIALVLAVSPPIFLVGGVELGLGYLLLALMVILLLTSFGRGWSIESVVMGAAAGMLAAVSLGLWYHFGSLSHLLQGIREVLTENLEASLRVYEKMGFSDEGKDLLRERGPQIISAVLQVIPALAFAGFVTFILINLFLLYRRFPDRHSFFMSTGDLREWKSPESLVWCFIVSGFFLFLPGWEALQTVALNLFLVIAVFYFFQGLAIVAFYFHQKNVPFFLRSLAYCFIVFEQIFMLFVVGLGLFDLWGDFRRLKKKDLDPSRAS